ncbi:MAG: hypothetical protein SPL00_04450 [Bacilli bacterium]|nr:hypothetical protein [Bacilli bacterium]
MKKKGLLLLLTSLVSVTAVSTAIVMSNSSGYPLSTRADKEPYTLTINASNKSNFVQDGDVYRGTFKTALGNDIVFRTKSAPSSQEGAVFEFTSLSDYLINETPLRGVTSIEFTGHYLRNGSLSTFGSLHVYYLEDLDMASLDKDDLTNSDKRIEPVSEYHHQYVVETGNSFDRAGSLYYYIGNKDYVYDNSDWVIESVKFVFSCQSTKTYVSVTSSDSSKGNVAIDNAVSNDKGYKVVANGTSVKIHAYPFYNYQNDKFCLFKGWHLNGSEQIISTDADYTFVTEQDGVYKFVAEFIEAPSETFRQGVRLCYQEEWLGNMKWYEEDTDTFVKSYDGAYYDLESYVGTASGKGNCEIQSYDEDDLWHQHARGTSALTPYLRLNKNYSKYYKADGHGNQEKVDVKDFDPDKVSCIELVLDKSDVYARDDLSITGGNFVHTKLDIDDTDHKKISKFYIDSFTKGEIKISIPDNISNVYFFKVKRLVVHYKVAIPQLEQ